jgi:hypothetical protein
MEANGNGHKMSLRAIVTAGLTAIVGLYVGNPRVAALSPQGNTPSQSVASAPPASAPTMPNTPEMTSHDAIVTFKVNVRLVQVRVVVRDSHGNRLVLCTKKNFQLFDNRKPQIITKSDVEKPAGGPGTKHIRASQRDGSSCRSVARRTRALHGLRVRRCARCAYRPRTSTVNRSRWSSVTPVVSVG